MLQKKVCGIVKRLGLLILLGMIPSVMSACSVKQSILGTWRLESGKFSYMSRTYDRCAIEFTDFGEYILYEGDNYEEDYYHGSYTYNGDQISLTIDDMFRSSVNCTVDNDRMVLVSSRGSATFVKVDTQMPATQFDDSVIREGYQNEGYEVDTLTMMEKDNYTRVYQTRLKRSYRYMDEEILRRDCYTYSQIGHYWYRSSSEEVSANENWRINGLWTLGNTTLYIHSFTSTEAVVDHYHDMGVYTDYNYSGKIAVRNFKNVRGEENTVISFPSNHGSVSIDKDEGVLKYTYQGE